MENEPWYKKCIRCKNRMFGICMADVTIKQFAENGSICPLWEEKTMEIKPCPFCGSEDLYVRDNSGHYVACKNCDAYGPYGKGDEEAIQLWNLAPRVGDNDCDYPNLTGGCHIFPGRNKKEPKMEKYCKNCVHISEEIEGKVYCCETVNEIYGCNYYEPKNPFAYDFRICRHCKHSYGYQVAGTDTIVLRCGRNIGRSKKYVCDKWEAKEPEPAPLTPSNPNELEPFILEAKDELKYIQQKESTHNQMQQLAEEAAELAQAALKFNRMMGCGCYTPVNPKDARDAVIEETADVLLCLEAAFPHRPGNKGFYSNLARIYQEKAKRWAERLKEHDN